MEESKLGNQNQHPNFGRGKFRVNFDAVNHDIRKKLWDGQLPIKINLSKKDICINKAPKALYMMIPRLNYFTYVLKKVKDVFDEYVSEDSKNCFQEMYFEYNGEPLKWDVPIGVQFDTIIGLGGDSQDKAKDLPWELEFHYRGCPEDLVKLKKFSHFIDINYIKFSFINALKESHVLRMGSAHEILTQMKKSEEEKLLQGIDKHNYESFWEINQTLCDKHVADMKKYAVRVFSNKYNRFVQPCFAIGELKSNFEAGTPEQTQDFEKWEQDNYDMTIGQYMLKAFPNLFKLEQQEEAKNDDTNKQKIIKTKRFDIVCHGLKIDLETPMYWLQLNMSYLDNFLYISFHS